MLGRIPLKEKLTRKLILLEFTLKKKALRIRVDILENSENFKFIVKTLCLRADFFKNIKEMFVHL